MKPVSYEALDKEGKPFIRPARIISELPWRERKAALSEALAAVSKHVGIEAKGQISFGIPVFNAFGLTSKEVRNHPSADLLMIAGGDIGLELIPGFMASDAMSRSST
ncbi:MAG: hypothetical protein ACNJA3_27525 (plasmid) [Pseudomonas rhizophila]|uniref:hypothetical protein n=1 Tax=Pseudomonas rhizophila TaxID=2045200 RepID=UPI003F6AE489